MEAQATLVAPLRPRFLHRWFEASPDMPFDVGRNQPGKPVSACRKLGWKIDRVVAGKLERTFPLGMMSP